MNTHIAANKIKRKYNPFIDAHKITSIMVTHTAVGKILSRHCCDPESYWFKGVGLISMSILAFGFYFCNDNPGALEASRLRVGQIFCLLKMHLILLSYRGKEWYFTKFIAFCLQEEIRDAMDMSTTQYTILLSMYSLPNIITPIFGGTLANINIVSDSFIAILIILSSFAYA